MPERIRALFVTPLFSPFQIEVADVVNREPDIDYRIAFGMQLRQARGQPHWLNYEYDTSRYTVIPEGRNDVARWYVDEIRRVEPDVLISGQMVGDPYRAVLDTRRSTKHSLGFWMEPPDFTKPWHRRQLVRMATALRLSFADFVLAIGDRAEAHFRRAAPHAAVRLLPYGEDLSRCFAATPDEKLPNQMAFLFSGQLRERHNIDKILDALVMVAERHAGKFTFTFSGKGPEQERIERYRTAHPELRDSVRMGGEFSSWSDRLTSFCQSHVLVYPCKHAGWGLVIPEAMAAGMPVITTRNAEAGRYFIRHRVNGIFIEQTAKDLAREMAWCIENPAAVRRMGEHAREAARDGDASSIGKCLASVLREQAANSTETRAKRRAFEVARRAHVLFRH